MAAALTAIAGSSDVVECGFVLRMGWQHISGDTIAVRQHKTAALPAVEAVVDEETDQRGNGPMV